MFGTGSNNDLEISVDDVRNQRGEALETASQLKRESASQRVGTT